MVRSEILEILLYMVSIGDKSLGNTIFVTLSNGHLDMEWEKIYIGHLDII